MRKPRKSAREDPGVDEIRRIRAKLWREAGGTVASLKRLLDEREAARQDITGKNGEPASRHRKMAAKKVTARIRDKRSSRRPKAKSKVYELAGSLRDYAVAPISPSQVRDYVRREVARAAAQEGCIAVERDYAPDQLRLSIPAKIPLQESKRRSMMPADRRKGRATNRASEIKGRKPSCLCCRKSHENVGTLVEAGNGQYICSDCLDLCQDIVDQEKARRQSGDKLAYFQVRMDRIIGMMMELKSQFDPQLFSALWGKRPNP